MDLEAFSNENRKQIMKRVRRALRRTGDLSNAARIDPVRPVVRPKPGPEDDLIAHFRECLQRAGGIVAELGATEKIPTHVAGVLKEKGAPMKVVLGADEGLRALDWGSAGLSIAGTEAIESDYAGVSRAVCAMAETGSVVLCSGPDNPTSINFLVKYHFVMLTREQVVPYFEDTWNLLRSRFDKGRWARAVNFVTGPSTTGDVEATLTVGVHGPGHFEALLID